MGIGDQSDANIFISSISHQSDQPLLRYGQIVFGLEKTHPNVEKKIAKIKISDKI